jgi:hypothetical protein
VIHQPLRRAYTLQTIYTFKIQENLRPTINYCVDFLNEFSCNLWQGFFNVLDKQEKRTFSLWFASKWHLHAKLIINHILKENFLLKMNNPAACGGVVHFKPSETISL